MFVPPTGFEEGSRGLITSQNSTQTASGALSFLEGTVNYPKRAGDLVPRGHPLKVWEKKVYFRLVRCARTALIQALAAFA